MAMRLNLTLKLLSLLALAQAGSSAVLFASGAIFHHLSYCAAGGLFGLAALAVNWAHYCVHQKSLETCLKQLQNDFPQPEVLSLAAILLLSDGRVDEARLLIERHTRRSLKNTSTFEASID